MKKMVIAGLLIISVACAFHLKKHHNKNQIEVQSLKEKLLYSEMTLGSYDATIAELKNSILNHFEYENEIIPVDVLNSVLEDRPLLVLRFEEVQCSDCVDQQIAFLKEMPEEIRVKIVLFGNYQRDRTMKIFKDINKIEFPVYNLDLSPSSFQNMHVPFYFTIDEDNVVSDVFVPIVDFPELTKKYLESIRQMKLE